MQRQKEKHDLQHKKHATYMKTATLIIMIFL